MAADAPQIAAELGKLDAASPLYASKTVEMLLAAAQAAGASDVHLQPTAAGLAIRWRLDGVLQPVGEIARGSASDVVSRLKVLAELPTYRSDVPQEGRIRQEGERARAGEAAKQNGSVEMRVSTFPTLHGERAVVRLFAGGATYSFVNELGLPAEVEEVLTRALVETSGAILLTGPAGSGKTTTAYACLRQIGRQSSHSRNLVTLEDPIEVALPGVSQSQVQPAAGFTLATGLRSLMRQDPEVVLVGEVRDRETAETVFQAALTGHLVISTFHAGSAAGAISRLLDMGIEPYLLTSGLRSVVHQRLVRRLCECATEMVKGADRFEPYGETNTLTQARSQSERGRSLGSDDWLGLRVSTAKKAVGCDRCRHTGYSGRLVLAELLPPLAGVLRRAVLDRRDTAELARVAVATGMTTVFRRACAAVEAGQTDPAEVRRVLGFVDENPTTD
jgi:type II secretory ATPase GspE/PulE/Tfp pilus assembly ATPase PilB-like protein